MARPASYVSLVIFDCDGVLVDSEPVANGVLIDMLAELGLSLTLVEAFDAFLGRSMADILLDIERRLGRPAPGKFVEELGTRTAAALARSLRPVEGITEVLDALVVPYCVASSGGHEKMRMTLGLTGLLPRFEGRLFSATDVPRGKPAPDVFLHAARSMGVEPAHAAVIEDTPVGVRAGVAAGMLTYGYAAAARPERLLEAGAANVFTIMSELPTLLGDAARAR